MTSSRIAELLSRLRENKCTADEIAELDAWYHNLRGGRPDFEAWAKEAGGEEQLSAQLFDRFNQKIHSKQHGQTRRMWYRIAAAVVVVATAGLLFIPKEKAVVNTTQASVQKVVAPGTNKAVLTLADGSTIALGGAAKGYLAKQEGGISIKQAGNNKIVYEQNGAASTVKLLYNTIATPRAGQYEVELPDGSKVWLNAETQLRYPVKFMGNDRKVQLTGEAYFEVAHNKAMPFKVETAQQTVTVLGTHFNIKGYSDEDAIETTLLQGSVSINNQLSGQNQMLIPGKQANILRDKGLISIANANVDEVMAWKNGYFIFDNKDIKSIMKLISRWYDVDVTFKLTKSVRFGGTFSRSSDLDKLLKHFELLGNLHFEMKERRIIVSN